MQEVFNTSNEIPRQQNEKCFKYIYQKILIKFMIKSLQKVNIEETYLNTRQDTYDKPTTDIILNSEKLKAFHLRLGTRQRCPLLPPLFNIVLKILAIPINEEKEINRIQIGKEVKLSLFADDMILYINKSA